MAILAVVCSMWRLGMRNHQSKDALFCFAKHSHIGGNARRLRLFLEAFEVWPIAWRRLLLAIMHAQG